jgi:hypothetical protein
MGILWRRLWALLRPIFVPYKAVPTSAAIESPIQENQNQSQIEQADSDCACQPLIIPVTEVIIRAIYYNVHVDKNGKLKWRAFEPTEDTDEISIMRGGCMTPTECKQKAKVFEKPDNKLYRGFAALSTGAVRLKGFEVTDSRKYYCGHGHISIGVMNVKPVVQEPIAPEATNKIREIAKELIKLSAYHRDPNHEADLWPEEIALVPAPRAAQ